MDAESRLEGRYSWVECLFCAGTGSICVPDNGTNFGEETCDDCWGEGGGLRDEFGNSLEDNGER